MYKRFVRKPGEDMNKPYIWIDDLDTWFTDEDYQNLDDLLKKDMFPLYTHPVNELTDKEIKFIAYPFESVYTTYDKKTDTDTVHTRFDQLGFARAILRKAQEK